MLRFILAIILLILLFLLSKSVSLEQFTDVKSNPYHPVSMKFNDGDKRKLNVKVDRETALKLYDYTTLFYNIFLDYNNEHLVFLGPKLLNLKDKYMDFSVIFNGSKTTRSQTYDGSHYFYFKYGVKNVAENNSVEIHINGHKKQVNIAKNNYKCGDRILITKQKNNRSKWLVDWIKHYTDRYNVTNIIIFDNNSNEFDTINNELAQFKHVQFIPYNFPFGIPKLFPSNFLQHSLMEIGFQQFCKDDAYIFNFDIDELLAVDPTHLDKMLKGNSTYYEFKDWFVPMTLDKDSDYSFKDFLYKDANPHDKSYKYIVNKRNTDTIKIHYPKTKNKKLHDGAYFLHYKGITTNWKHVFGNGNRLQQVNDTSNLVKIDNFNR